MQAVCAPLSCEYSSLNFPTIPIAAFLLPWQISLYHLAKTKRLPYA